MQRDGDPGGRTGRGAMGKEVETVVYLRLTRAHSLRSMLLVKLGVSLVTCEQ